MSCYVPLLGELSVHHVTPLGEDTWKLVPRLSWASPGCLSLCWFESVLFSCNATLSCESFLWVIEPKWPWCRTLMMNRQKDRTLCSVVSYSLQPHAACRRRAPGTVLGSFIHGIFQARILEWVAFPSPGDLPIPGIKPGFPALQKDSLPTGHQWSPPLMINIIIF